MVRMRRMHTTASAVDNFYLVYKNTTYYGDSDFYGISDHQLIAKLTSNGGAERRDFWIGAAFPTAVGFASVGCVFVIVAIDGSPLFFNDNDFVVGLQIVTVVLAGSILLLGKLATIFGRRMRSLHGKQ